MLCFWNVICQGRNGIYFSKISDVYVTVKARKYIG